MSDPISSEQYLTIFYEKLNGMKWLKNLNWCSTAPLSEWYGVETDSGGNIIGINLHHNQLEGTLPPELFMISTLRILILSSNKIEGNIPESFATSSIETLDLSKNSLGGVLSLPVVESISRMKFLAPSSVNLSMNTGFYLPDNLGELKFRSKKSLKLSSCSIIGSIPESIGRLTWLDELDLSCNALEGPIPETLCSCRSLSILFLQDNRLCGELPASLGSLTSLTNFTAFQNKITGGIPHSVRNLRNLTVFAINDNNFDSEISVGAVMLISRIHAGRRGVVDLSACQPGFTLPENINEVATLGVRSINLSRCSLRGKVPDSLGQLVDLEYLNLSNNALSGVLTWSVIRLITKNAFRWPQVLSGNVRHQDPSITCGAMKPDVLGTIGFCLPQDIDVVGLETKIIDFSNCSLVGLIPSKIGDLTNLTVLKLSSNELHGSIPASVCLLENLTILDLSNNALDGPIPSGIGKLERLITLNLSSNYLSGSLPSGIGQFGFIENLILGNNRFSGEITGEISNLRTLRVLSLEGNSLTGTIPSSIASLTALEVINISKNKLTGVILPIFREIAKLRVLNISVNMFFGEIPDIFAELPELEVVDLSENEFSKKVPDYLFDFAKTRQFSFAYNYLDGKIPEDIMKQNTKQKSDSSDRVRVGIFDAFGCEGAIERTFCMDL